MLELAREETMPSTPKRCECGGPAICADCEQHLPSYSVMALLDQIQRLEKNGIELSEALKQAGKQWQQHNLNSTATQEQRSAFIDRITNWWNTTALQAIAKAEREC